VGSRPFPTGVNTLGEGEQGFRCFVVKQTGWGVTDNPFEAVCRMAWSGERKKKGQRERAHGLAGQYRRIGLGLVITGLSGKAKETIVG